MQMNSASEVHKNHSNSLKNHSKRLILLN